jgi:hypothetical protein
MGKINLSVRFYGNFNENKNILELLRTYDKEIYFKDSLTNIQGSSASNIDFAILNLTPHLDFNSNEDEIFNELHRADSMIGEIFSRLPNFEKNQLSIDLYVRIIEEEDRASFSLPEKIINTAAILNLPISIGFDCCIS